MRQYESRRNLTLSIDESNRAEPAFADSAHSVMMQLVDVISYLVLQLERHELERNTHKSSFATRLLAAAQRIRSDLIVRPKFVGHFG